ncbi:MAG: hypothetical protein A3I02_11330 [Betaproteobacteria bacterium RIFCSPLOWO2_02_FULL_67_26]|nr:MAG: hypothetical protein A3I02_11330 [Betaproteobacteria bacterium RIFCSPLOWO2_02_FULL_67_26]
MDLRVAVLILALIAFHAPSQAQFGSGKGEKKMGQARTDSGKNAIQASGLRPVYPVEARCPEIASPYASPTRYDGSARAPWAFGGLHGGIDISLDEGTPLLALAAGTVAMKGEGGMLEGIYLWLRHAPEDTGLAYWVYSKYQHLESMPDLEHGAPVRLGQVIARSGRTGTVGKHYGMSGYPHLHLTTRKSPEDVVTVGSRESFGGAALLDPLAIYHEAGAVPIPYATADGKIATPGARVVWPVACRPK